MNGIRHFEVTALHWFFPSSLHTLFNGRYEFSGKLRPGSKMIFASSSPPSKVRGIRVDCASNHSYLESRSRSSWTASAILKWRLCIGFSHLRWWIRQSRGRHQKKVIKFSLLSSFPQKMAWYRYLKAKENPFEPAKTSKHRSQHVHWSHCKYNAT